MVSEMHTHRWEIPAQTALHYFFTFLLFPLKYINTTKRRISVHLWNLKLMHIFSVCFLSLGIVALRGIMLFTLSSFSPPSPAV